MVSSRIYCKLQLNNFQNENKIKLHRRDREAAYAVKSEYSTMRCRYRYVPFAMLKTAAPATVIEFNCKHMHLNVLVTQPHGRNDEVPSLFSSLFKNRNGDGSRNKCIVKARFGLCESGQRVSEIQRNSSKN